MPSPFPGMDPYLEADLWTTLHSQLAAEIARQLSPRLRPRYVALTERRFVIDSDDEDVTISAENRYPDVALAPSGREGGLAQSMEIPAAPHTLTTVIPEVMPVYSVEIKDVANRTLVTAIEILSPANKRGEGRLEYLAKRARLLRSGAHLMEIDLLRKGQRVPMLDPLPPAAYFVLLSRVANRPMMEVWGVTIDQPLPTVPVPLLADDPDVPLDLQAALSAVYDINGYDLLVNYKEPPDVPLPPEADAWADGVLRSAGLRP